MSWVEEKIKEGKLKMGICEIEKCTTTHEELLYRVTNKYVCGKCIDEIDVKMNSLRMGE